MAKLEISIDSINNPGQAQALLREITGKLGQGYKRGLGWEYIESDEDHTGETLQAPAPKVAEPLPTETEKTKVDVTIPANTDPVKTLDQCGVRLKIDDVVFVEGGYTNASGEKEDVSATIIDIMADGELKLHDFTDKHDLSGLTFKSTKVVRDDEPITHANGTDTTATK